MEGTLSVGKAISDAWNLVSGLKWAIWWPLMAAAFLISVFAGFSMPFLMNMPQASNPTGIPALHLSLQDPHSYIAFFFLFILSLIVWYVISVLVMLGVRKALGMPVSVPQAFADCMAVKWPLMGLLVVLFIINAIYGVVNAFTPDFLHTLTYVIMLFFVIPIYIFSLPLIVFKRCDLAYALSSGFAKMSEHWVAVFLSCLAMFLILLFSAIPFGIGLIWTIPMYYALMGVIFRDIYGLQSNGIMASD